MTRVHVRLLGPCFKTGPKSTQSSSVADRYCIARERQASRRSTPPLFTEGTHVRRERARTGDGTGSVYTAGVETVARARLLLDAPLKRAA